MSRLSQRIPHRRAADPHLAEAAQRPGLPPEPATAHPQLGLRERGRARRRLRHLRKLRELQLRDLGGLVFDLYRFGEKREPLVREKLDRIIATDKEERALEELLGERRRTRDVRQPGVGGACPSCGELHSSLARFCSQCGTPLAGPAAPGGDEPEGRAWASELADSPQAGALAQPDEAVEPEAAEAPQDEELPIEPAADAATSEVDAVGDGGDDPVSDGSDATPDAAPRARP